MEEKKVTQKILEKILANMARALMWRHKPRVVGITGSIGKTSAKDAIYHVLKNHYNVRRTEKNYNNELGLPLTIIGASSGERSLVGWLRVGLVWFFAMVRPNYPEVLVLEYGIDHPGDMERLTAIAPPHVAVVTAVAHSHEVYFGGVEGIAHEKGKLIEAITCEGLSGKACAVILNGDDKLVRAMKKRTTRAVYTYGLTEGVDFHATSISLQTDKEQPGITFKAEVSGRSVPIRIPEMVGEHSLYAVLAAISVAEIFKVNLVDVALAFTDFHLPRGRMRLFPGKNDTLLLDDSYNASSPESVVAAVAALDQLDARRKIVVLGDMLELGETEQVHHEAVAKVFSIDKCDIVITAGRRMAHTTEIIQKSGYELGESLFHVDTPMEARDILESILTLGDAVLVKGSQGMRMEIVSEYMLADNLDPSECLSRQGKSWKDKPFTVK